MIVTDDARYRPAARSDVISVTDPAGPLLDEMDTVNISVRSRYARLGVDMDLMDWAVQDETIVAEVEQDRHTGSVDPQFSEGDTVGRLYGFTDEEVITGDELEAVVEEYDLPAEVIADDTIALETEPGYLRPAPLDEIDASTIEDMDKDDLMEQYQGWDAGLVERDDQYVVTEPVEMPGDVYGVIQGTEHQDEYHLNSRLIDPGYGAEQEDGQGIICEVLSTAEDINGRRPRPTMQLVRE